MNGTPPVYHQATVQFLKRADTNVLMIVRSDKYYRKYVVPYLYDFCQLSSDITFNVTQQIVKVKDRKGALYFKSYELNRIQGLEFKFLFIDETIELSLEQWSQFLEIQ